jgi:lauroyl/myristoyl acyltransferase
MTLARSRIERTSAVAAAPHAPETGRLRRLLGPFHVTGVFWYRVHGWGARSWPASCHWVVVTFFTTFFFCTLFTIRKAVAANLEAALGPCGFFRRQARIYRLFFTFAWCLTERYERLCTDHPFTVDSGDLERWQQLASSPRGMILLTAHLGNWEVGSLLPHIRETRPVHVVREAEGDPAAQRYLAGKIAERCKGDFQTHYAEDPQLGVVLLEALRRGEIVALQGDRPRVGGKVSTRRLFGRPYPLPVGPAALARAAGVPIVPVFVARVGRRHYHCTLRPPIEVASSDDRGQDVESALERFAGELQQAISEHPFQWFCFRRLWPE